MNIVFILFQAADLVAPISPDIVALVHSLVVEGVTDVSEIQAHIRLKVKAMFHGRAEPEPFNRRFFPSRRDVSNIVYRAKSNLRDGKNDLAQLEECLRQLGDDVIYRPPGEERLLLIHQSEWQKRLLSRYGEMVFLDGTYKTTRYTIPLYQLCVKTNVAYLPVAVIFMQHEDTASIKEALQIVKDRNPTWSPKVAMIDCDEKEEVAFRQVFPGRN